MQPVKIPQLSLPDVGNFRRTDAKSKDIKRFMCLAYYKVTEKSIRNVLQTLITFFVRNDEEKIFTNFLL